MTRIDSHRRPTAVALLTLALLAPVTAWLGMKHIGAKIDADNRALKAPDTREAHDITRLLGEFGSDQVIWMGFTAAPGLDLTPRDQAAVAAILDALVSVPGVEGSGEVRHIDSGMDCASVTLRPAAGDTCAATAERVLARARSLLPATLELSATGPPLGEWAIARSLDQERRTIVPAVGLVMLVLLAAVYRSFRLAALGLLPAVIAISWTSGLFAVLGHRINPIAAMLEPVVLTVGVAASVHVLEAYLRICRGESPLAASRRVRAELATPTLLTTVTTMVGFLSLLVSPIPAMRSFGVFAALGVALAATLAITVLPVLLAAFHTTPASATTRAFPVSEYVSWLGRHHRRVMLAVAVATVVMATAWSRAEIDNNPLHVLPPGSSFRKTTDAMVARLGSVEGFGVLVPAGSAANTPDGIALLGARLLDHRDTVASVAPARRGGHGSVLVQAALLPCGSRQRLALFDDVEQMAADLEWQGVRPVGSAVQIARDSERLITAQLGGLALIVPALALAIGLGLGSWRLGVLSLIPNVLPCVLLYGATAMLGRSLSVATVMIGSTMMGLIVDDTIHLLHHYKLGHGHGLPAGAAIAAALRAIGRPVTVTSAVLTAGLGIGVLGDLTTTVEFSVMAAATVVVAWVLDVVVLPATLLSIARAGVVRGDGNPGIAAPIVTGPIVTGPIVTGPIVTGRAVDVIPGGDGVSAPYEQARHVRS